MQFVEILARKRGIKQKRRHDLAPGLNSGSQPQAGLFCRAHGCLKACKRPWSAAFYYTSVFRARCCGTKEASQSTCLTLVLPSMPHHPQKEDPTSRWLTRADTLELGCFFSRRMSWKFAHSLPPFLILLTADNLGNIFWRAEVTLLWLPLFFFHPAGLSLDVPFRVLSLSTPPKTERCSSFEFPENPRHILTKTHTTSFAMAHLAAEFLMIPNQTPSRWRWALVQRRIHRAWHGAQHVVGVPSNQNVLWVGEVMTSVRFHNMWSNYSLESVPIPRCDFYFFLLSHLSISPMNKTKKRRRRRSLRPKCTLIFQNQPKDKLCSLGPILSQNDTIGLNWTANSTQNHPHLPRWFTSCQLSEPVVTVGAIYLHLLGLRLANSFFHTKSRFTQVRGFSTITLLYSRPKFSSTCKHMHVIITRIIIHILLLLRKEERRQFLLHLCRILFGFFLGLSESSQNLTISFISAPVGTLASQCLGPRKATTVSPARSYSASRGNVKRAHDQ